MWSPESPSDIRRTTGSCRRARRLLTAPRSRYRCTRHHVTVYLLLHSQSRHVQIHTHAVAILRVAFTLWPRSWSHFGNGPRFRPDVNPMEQSIPCTIWTQKDVFDSAIAIRGSGGYLGQIETRQHPTGRLVREKEGIKHEKPPHWQSVCRTGTDSTLEGAVPRDPWWWRSTEARDHVSCS
eukprot:1805786-Rhodomonas_salina.1